MKNRVFLILLVFIVVIVSLLSFVLIFLSKSQINEVYLENLHSQKKEKITYFHNFMKDKTLILNGILNNNDFKLFIKNRENIETIQNLFLTFCSSNKEIFQFRFLDENGQEIIRVNNYKKPYIVTKEKLQNKKTRYYFIDTLSKNVGEFYYSDIDLNKENGKIEEPIIPTIRIATPVFLDKERKGILILNINLNSFFNQLKLDPTYDVNLIYGDGNIIISNNTKYNWSRDYNLKERIFDLYPFISKDFTKYQNTEDERYFISKLISETKTQIFMLLVHKEYVNYKAIETNIKNIIYILILFILLGILAGYFLSLYIEKIVKEKTILQNKVLEGKLLNSVIDSTDDLIFYKDKDFKYIGCNNSFERFVGKNREYIIGKDDFALFKKEYAELFRKMDKKMLKERVIRKNNEWVIFEGKDVYLQTKKIPFVYNENHDTGILGISRDITELHNKAKQIEEQSYIDELTKVYNRKAYNENIKELIDLYDRYKEAFCLIMFDIDDFKLINDNYGHNKGDEVLYKIAQLTQNSIRKTDKVFRVGGEEFIVILKNINSKDAFQIAEDIRVLISKEKIIERKAVTISIGLTQYKDKEKEEVLFKRVDDLMYKSKKEGKNRISSDIV